MTTSTPTPDRAHLADALEALWALRAGQAQTFATLVAAQLALPQVSVAGVGQIWSRLALAHLRAIGVDPAQMQVVDGRGVALETTTPARCPRAFAALALLASARGQSGALAALWEQAKAAGAEEVACCLVALAELVLDVLKAGPAPGRWN